MGKQPYIVPKCFDDDNRLYLDDVGSYLQLNQTQATISLHIAGKPPIPSVLDNGIELARIDPSAITAVLINCKTLVMNLVDSETSAQNIVIVYDVDTNRVTAMEFYLGINATLLIDDRYNQNESTDVALIYIGPSMQGPDVIVVPEIPT